ncbi:putative cytochrome p450 protein [Eutypa lata UCREL1]|uniref:Putative cytochrome p450 protein n=1 Tax=Eutypa lata (strain UCR-EL1) TaxID=1287681 RepID=M7SDC1_EUTLA|nr:putative cytochrome p450 protein [Eutypa lata UCREL1]
MEVIAEAILGNSFRLGDTFILVTPFHMLLHTANAEAIYQFTSRREAFPKPLETYKILSMFGENVVTTEGAVWRMHRKVTSASFNEKNAALVFKVAIEQAQGMVDYWLQREPADKITTVEHDTMGLTLNIIGYVGFGLRLLWPGQALPADADPRLAKYASLDVPPGHSLNFKESIAGVLEYLVVLLATPPAIIKFLADKVEDVRQGDKGVGMDIMRSLVATSYEDEQSKGKTSKSKGASSAKLTDDEIIGNAFIMFLAGHETSANILHFVLLELANNPGAQRELQKDIDTILGGSDPSTWEYDEKVNAMMASMLGATMNEMLRLMPPVVEVPKMVSSTQDQMITLDGEKHTLPSGMYIGLNIANVQRNPRYWPSKPSKIGDSQDLNDWVPERWFRPSLKDEQSIKDGADTEDFGGNDAIAGADTGAQLFRPTRGSFVPFSDGARSCLGRRIAQIEIIATLAVLFQQYSVENAVDDWASDEEVERMTREQKEEVYQKATQRSRQTLRGATSVITLKLHGGKSVPIRMVRRGQEKFVNWIDS